MWEFIELFFSIAVVLAVVAGVAVYLAGNGSTTRTATAKAA